MRWPQHTTQLVRTAVPHWPTVTLPAVARDAQSPTTSVALAIVPRSPRRAPEAARRQETPFLAFAALGAMLKRVFHFAISQMRQPTGANAEFSRGNALAARGKLNEAITAYREALKASA